MTTTGDVRREQRLVSTADAALRAGSRAKLAAATLVSLAVVLIAWSPPGGTASTAWAIVASVCGLVGLHTLCHGYHFGHAQGRWPAWLAVVLSSGPVGPVVVWVAVAATGGRGAARP